ncbi:DNA adenine methylase [Ruegeria arenilitoris]|uniref:DNA adenine methylase n=1 Tax=Ruegeria arenilitoris TaxID=1173585 RepID=UPI00147FC28E|nr:Dam family site-specific DNA-(adenine-N6)-methyltransferase [Ruegeria arenilitoris]
MKTKSKLLKWAGSKSQVADQITPYLNFELPYIEPFCGSAVFFFENLPSNCHLNDLNADLISFFRHVREVPREVWSCYNSIPVEEDAYYLARAKYNDLGDSPEKAGHFVYLNHFCFNGLYRTNKAGRFNTPYGGHHKPKKKLTETEFGHFSNKLRDVRLTSEDFEKFLFGLKPAGSCIYMDPPYFTDDERVFGEYGASTFKNNDLQRLFKVAVALSDQNRIVISYKNCSEFLELFSDFVVGDIAVTRNVGGFAGRRKSEKELVAVLGA